MLANHHVTAQDTVPAIQEEEHEAQEERPSEKAQHAGEWAGVGVTVHGCTYWAEPMYPRYK